MIDLIQGGDPRVREATRQEIEEAGARVVTPDLPSARVRAMFEGHALDRAWAVASVTPLKREAIFGRSTDETSRYRSGALYAKIGRAVVAHCSAHPSGRDDCERCARHREVCAELREAPLEVLREAARHSDPDDQLVAAVWKSGQRVRRRRAEA